MLMQCTLMAVHGSQLIMPVWNLVNGDYKLKVS
jgi:hypothetical protein